ncbi:MAG: phosphoribosylglycinamide formyltransferase [Paludibacteraceae bacterium]|nr:phosphoribosylglycinamide formyltransferase [Paludibacteraceae bacterium]
MKNIAILASGSGSNAENIVNYFRGRADISFKIYSNKKDAFVLERAKRLGVPSETFLKSELEDGTFLSKLVAEKVDFVVLAGFLLKIPDAMLAVFPDKIVNIHPSLLPKYGGKGMYGMKVHEAVVAAGEKESGITIHTIDDHYDEGSVVFQATVPVLPSDSPDEVAHKVHELEYKYFPKVIDDMISKL